VNLMKSRFLPDIGLTANYMMINPNPYNGFSNEFGGDWSIGVAINIPIFHWNDKSHTLRAARHEQKAAEYQYKEARELISLQVQQALFSVSESSKKLHMAQESISLAEENLRIVNNSFAEGIVKTTDVLEAQALWQNAWSDLIDARMEFQLSRVNLKKVIGSGE
jgi:outer membrane protein TolC